MCLELPVEFGRRILLLAGVSPGFLGSYLRLVNYSRWGQRIYLEKSSAGSFRLSQDKKPSLLFCSTALGARSFLSD